MILTDLADACRKSGLKVVEVDGWRTRGHGQMTAVETIVPHHTATKKSIPGDYPSMRVVRDGREGLPGPLAQIGLGRSGTVYVIAAGVCYHAGAVSSRSTDNWHAIGIEAEADGLSSWPEQQMDAYARLCAALCEHYGLTADRVLAHKEIAAPLGRKADPNFPMDAFRARVTDCLEDDMFSDEDRAMLKEIAKDAERARAGAFKRDKEISERLDKIEAALAAVTRKAKS